MVNVQSLYCGRRNRILNALSDADLALLEPQMETVSLKCRQRLQSANRRIDHVYLVESGIVSVVAIGNGDRRQAEVAIVGREGMTGVPVVLGSDRSPCDHFVQAGGVGQRISADDLRSAMSKSNSLRHCLLKFAHVFAVQSSYTALSNARGSLPERLARWLLMALDRLDADTLAITHEFLALMLGVRRAGVTTALGDFQQLGVIDVRRGVVSIRDRSALEEASKGLYGIPEAEMERLFH